MPWNLFDLIHTNSFFGLVFAQRIFPMLLLYLFLRPRFRCVFCKWLMVFFFGLESLDSDIPSHFVSSICFTLFVSLFSASFTSYPDTLCFLPSWILKFVFCFTFPHSISPHAILGIMNSISVRLLVSLDILTCLLILKCEANRAPLPVPPKQPFN